MNKKLILRIITIAVIVMCGAAASILLVHNRERAEEKSKTVSINTHYSYSEDKAEPHELLITSENGAYGLIRPDGSIVCAPEFDMLLTSAYGLYYYKEGTESGFLNSEARKIFTTEEIIATNISEDFVIYTRDGKSGFINIKNGTKTEAVYDFVYDFSEGMAAVCKDDKVGFINTLGELVIPHKYYSKGLYYFSQGLCSVIEGDPSVSASCYYIDTNGDKIIDPECSYGMQFYENRAFVKHGDKWILMALNGERVTETEFGPYETQMPGRFKDGFATVAVDGKYGVINENGEFVIKPEYDELLEMQDGKIVFKSEGKYGYMRKNGSQIIRPEYDKLTSFKNGMAVTALDSKCGVINEKGKVIIENEYQKTEILDSGIIKLWTDDKTYSYANDKGEIIWSAK